MAINVKLKLPFIQLSIVVLYCILVIYLADPPPKLILVSIDSMRYNFLDNIPTSKTEHFQYFIRNGVKAKSIRNVFPTSTYPNHYSLITGLYPESHGIVHNQFYDPDLDDYFAYTRPEDNFDSRWFDVGAEPIYVTNTKADEKRKSGSVMWPTGLAEVKGIAPDSMILNTFPYVTNVSRIDRIDYLISYLTAKENPINLGLLYFREPDRTAHVFGPESNEVTSIITDALNKELGYLIDKLKQNGLFKSTNIILTSDHGHATVGTRFVKLDDYVDPSWYKEGSEFQDPVVMNLFPVEGKEDAIVQALENVTDVFVYRKGGPDLEELHYTDNDRIAPIVVTGQEGVAIVKDEKARKSFAYKGFHGYDPRKFMNMRPFFLAMGPAFKKGFVSEPFDSVDIYPLMCHLLGITPASNNGSLENVKQLLVEDPFETTTPMVDPDTIKNTATPVATTDEDASNSAMSSYGHQAMISLVFGLLVAVTVTTTRLV